MTTHTTTPAEGDELTLIYEPRTERRRCRTCQARIPTTTVPDFLFEDNHDNALCDACIKHLAPADHSAIEVLRVIRDATHRAPDDDTAADFLWLLSQGIELLQEDLEERAR